MTTENKFYTIMPIFSTIPMMVFIASMFCPSLGCLYDRNWKEKNMTTRAHIADYVIAGRVDSIYLADRHYIAEFNVFCVFKTNDEHAKFPAMINITVSTAPNVFCAMDIPEFDLDQSYIVLLTGNMTMGRLYPMTVNGQRAEFNLTQNNIDDMQGEFGAGKSMQVLNENDSMLKMCPNDLNEMMLIGEERVEDEMEDGYSTTPMSRKTPSDLKDGDMPKQTATPASDAQYKGTGSFIWGSPLLIILILPFGLIFTISG